ncbi:MAG: PHB depolymerase family esterase [Herpetosiphonaceae bacterium]|nr:PHB depolymerase family esterase [Herpetosiphonaceae bacterium]
MPILPGTERNAAPSFGGTVGQFVAGSYTNPYGTRTYKLSIPSGYHGQSVPLIIMLHGCTQTPEDFAAGTRMQAHAEAATFLIVYPAQSGKANRSGCWNWFQPSDQQRDCGEPSLIAGITRHVMASYHVDPQRVYVAGMSAGGAMAMIMGVTYPDLYAAIAVHSGLAYGAAQDLRSALTAMHKGGPDPARQPNRIREASDPYTRIVPTIIFHGDQDRTVDPRNGDQVLAQWLITSRTGQYPMDLSEHTTQGRVPNGHSYTRTSYTDPRAQTVLEQWRIYGAGHAWSGGSREGSFTDPHGPNASQEIVRFFLAHPHTPQNGVPTE